MHKLLNIYTYIHFYINKHIYILVWLEVWYKDRNEVFRISQILANSKGELRNNSVKKKTAFSETVEAQQTSKEHRGLQSNTL